MSAIVPMQTVSIAGLDGTRVPVFLSVPREQFHGDFPVRARVSRVGDPRDVVTVTGTFLGPTP